MNTTPQASRIKQLATKASSIGLLIIMTALGTSCASKYGLEAIADDPSVTYSTFTERLWEATSKENLTIEVPFSAIPEHALIQDGFVYTKNEQRQLFYIHRHDGNEPHTPLDHKTLRVVATPVAVTADACIEGIFLIVYLFAAMGSA